MQGHFVELSPKQQELILDHHAFVLSQTKHINLTSVKDENEGRLLHIEDSLAGLTELADAPIGLLADIGSGGGYPGIPLALASERKTLLIEAIHKKANILKLFIKEKGLEEQIEVLSMRSEVVARERKEQCSAVVVRAVAELPTIVELAAPLLCKGGLLICYKGQPTEEEIIRGKKAALLCGLEDHAKRSFFLSDKQTKRTILVYKKTSDPQIPLPRRIGMAKKRPLA